MEKSTLLTTATQQSTPSRANSVNETLYSPQAKEALKKFVDARLAGEDLFSMFTANIIKARATFTR